jgi:hypothetical protein
MFISFLHVNISWCHGKECRTLYIPWYSTNVKFGATHDAKILDQFSTFASGTEKECATLSYSISRSGRKSPENHKTSATLWFRAKIGVASEPIYAA